MTDFADAATAVLARHGTTSQQQRHQAGLLPAAELTDAILRHLFGAVETPAFLHPGAVPCTPVSDLPPWEWDELKQLRRSLDSHHNVAMELRRHEAKCSHCSDVRFAALVTVDWFGRQFTREFLLSTQQRD